MLGVLMNAEKYTEPSEEFQLLGFLWNLRTKIVKLLDSKQAKYLELLLEVTVENYAWTLEVVEHMLGFLAWICYVEPLGRFKMQAIYAWQGLFGDNHNIKKPVQGAQDGRLGIELTFWIDLLSGDKPIQKTIQVNPYPLSTTFIASDSSNTHISVLVGNHWEQFALHEGWKGGKCGWNINFPEAVGVKFAVRMFFDLHPEVTGVILTAFCDNTVVCDAWMAQRSRSPAINVMLLRIEELLVRNGCDLDITWINSEANAAADKISRNEIPDGAPRWRQSGAKVLPSE
ncbi:hypothetical protein P7C70_g8677, partial [Phenoliferia sp. Uapishka_3]